MDSLKRAIRFQNLDAKSGFAWFWGIMSSIDIVSYFLHSSFVKMPVRFGFGINDGNTRMLSVAGANLWPITIFFIIYSYVMYYEIFPVAINFSVTRKDFYKSVIIDNLKVTFLFATIQSILMKIDIYVLSLLNKTPMVDFKVVNSETDNIILMILSLFIVFLTITSIFNLLATLNYKFGWKIWVIIGLIFVGPLWLIGDKTNLIINWVLTTRVNTMQFVYLAFLTIIMYIILYVIIKDISVKNKIG
jgi:hypothetical protein